MVGRPTSGSGAIRSSRSPRRARRRSRTAATSRRVSTRERAESRPSPPRSTRCSTCIARRGATPASPKHNGDRASTAYAFPTIGDKLVNEITTADVLAVLSPIWNAKRETARRVRQRVGAVMKWAIAEGHRADNPAGEAIGSALPKNGNHRKHHRALPHRDVAAALGTVRRSQAWPATKLALEFMVLTAARSGEVRGARWAEMDLEAATWTVPGERMKAGRDHRVPLSARAVEILSEARSLSDGAAGSLVFPAQRGGALSDATLGKLMKDRGIAAVPHGFRSSFRDWCGETGVVREVAEAALAHVLKDKAEAAYARSDLLDRRRTVMETWAEYVSG